MADVIDEFLAAPLDQRARLALDAATAPAIRAFLGEPAYAEYAEIARRVQRATRKHLAGEDRNLIFIPGVMGSQLASTTVGGVWWIDARTRKRLDDLRLNPEGSDSANPKHHVEPITTDYSYEPFLAAVLERDDFAHVLFPYDWRLSLTRSTAGLRDTVLRLFEENGGKKVHLVAHSMGGLLVRATFAAYPELWKQTGRIIFLGTPHYGSPAIAGYLKNHLWGWELMALLGLYLSRPTFRSLWGVLELLPAPRVVYPGTRLDDAEPWTPPDPEDRYIHPCANFDLYAADDWKLELSAEEKAGLQRVLDNAAAFHRRLHEAHRALDQELRERMAIIAGVGQKTLFRLEYDRELFGLWERTKKITDRIPGDPHRDGDGRVPVASARLEDVQIRYVRGEHGGLPTIPAVYEDVFRWLNRKPMQLPTTPQGALGDHLAGDDVSPKAPHLAGPPTGSPDPEDPGYWRDEAFDAERLTALEARLAAGEMPGFNRLHIL